MYFKKVNILCSLNCIAIFEIRVLKEPQFEATSNWSVYCNSDFMKIKILYLPQ